ncbi:MAG: FGGY-family carbohydrate kinase [Pseudomonadota bacterium]
MSRDILIGIDAGTSVIKSVAFDVAGRQIARASVPNRYNSGPGGAATQPMARTWDDCAKTLRDLGQQLSDLAARVAAIAVTGQGDGTWLVGAGNAPVGEGWLWLDARAGAIAANLAARPEDAARFEATGTGLAACQQGPQLLHMKAHTPDALASAECAFHCKDWLYLMLTGVRATDPSEASFSFGNFRTGAYDTAVIESLGLAAERRLLPEICDGTTTTHPLTEEAAAAIGLRAGTPIALGFVDVTCTALGAGAHVPGERTGCTIVGTTGMHIECKAPGEVHINKDRRTGYVMPMPAPGLVAHIQTNMAGTLNIDWVLGLAKDVAKSLGAEGDFLSKVDGWIGAAPPGSLIFHPYISQAGERGPFTDHTARASLIGLSTAHGFADLVRGAVEGLAMASRDCYTAMGAVPDTVTLTGGAAQSAALRAILAGTLNAKVRRSERGEAGAAGAAMMAAVATGVYPTMDAAIAEWVVPHLSAEEAPDAALCATYDSLFPHYRAAQDALRPIWHGLEQHRDALP